MKTIDDVIKEVHKQTGIDLEICSAICRHPFAFTVDVMKDNNDFHDILFSKLFKFKLKNKFKND